MHLLHPDFTFNRPEDISPAFLKERGIQGLLLDLDGTLCATGSYPPRESVGRWLSEVRSSGVDLAMVSNNRNMSRVEQFCMDHGILHYTGRAGKPGNRGFRWACEVLRLEPRALAVVGDQIFTDVLGGNRAGMTTILVHSLDLFLWYAKLRRLAERPFLKPEEEGEK